MARRTITEIMGEYGLSSNSNDSAVSDLEESILSSTKSAIAELQSSGREQYAGQGLGLSSFTNQALAKQEKDIMSNVATTLAGYQYKESLADKQFAQTLAGYEYQSELETESALAQIQQAGQAESLSQLEQFFPNLVLSEIESLQSGNTTDTSTLISALSAFTQTPTIQNLSDEDKTAFTNALTAFGATYGALNWKDVTDAIGDWLS